MADGLIKCPVCGVVLPELAFQAQIAHMNEFHPDLVAERMAQAGFRKVDGEWIDLLADENE